VNGKDKTKLEMEIEENGVDDLEGEFALTVKQLALLNWKKIDRLEESMKDLVTRDDLKTLVRYSAGGIGVFIVIMEFVFHFTGV
jgi:hypothetical protein